MAMNMPCGLTSLPDSSKTGGQMASGKLGVLTHSSSDPVLKALSSQMPCRPDMRLKLALARQHPVDLRKHRLVIVVINRYRPA